MGGAVVVSVVTVTCQCSWWLVGEVDVVDVVSVVSVVVNLVLLTKINKNNLINLIVFKDCIGEPKWLMINFPLHKYSTLELYIKAVPDDLEPSIMTA